MTPAEWIIFANLLVQFGAKVATAWSDILYKAKAGAVVTKEERDATLALIDYAQAVPNTFLTPEEIAAVKVGEIPPEG